MTQKEYFQTHKSALEKWEHGEPVRSWIDKNGVLCIEYEDGAWWHYRVNNGELEWW